MRVRQMNKKKLIAIFNSTFKAVSAIVLFCLAGVILTSGIGEIFPNLRESELSGLIAVVIIIALVILINNYRHKIAELHSLIEYLDDEFDIYKKIEEKCGLKIRIAEMIGWITLV